MRQKEYSNLKLSLSVIKSCLSFLLLLFIIASGISLKIEKFLSEYISGEYLLFLSFVIILGAGASILFFPLNFYSGYFVEHKYNLSNQSISRWIWENAKSLLLSLVIGIPLLLLFYYIISSFGNMWWLPFAIVLFIFSVILARIVPVFILPLFYKISPIEDQELNKRIILLSEQAGIKVENVYSFNMSKNSKKANAAFTGIGKSKRILLSDTLLNKYAHDQIETVIAHELGHYKKKHIIKNIIIGTAASFITLFLLSSLYEVSVGWFNFTSIKQPAAIPIIALWGMVIGLIQTPLMNMLSRKYEYEADAYAVNSTLKPAEFISTLERLTEQNLGDRNPHPFIEWFFYSHPSVDNRIAAIKQIKLTN